MNRTGTIDWSETSARMRDDRQRISAAYEGAGYAMIRWFFPCLCAAFHRLSHHHHANGRVTIGRLFWQVNIFLTGANISPASDIGGGLFIPNPSGVTLYADAGRNLTVMALAGAGLSGKDGVEGIGGGYARLGDNVTLSYHSYVASSVRIGDNVHVSPGCMVDDDVEDGAVVVGPALRIRKTAGP